MSLVFCLFHLGASAQFSFGIKAGFNQNGVYTRHDPDFGGYKSMGGFHAGFYSQFFLTKKLSLNPELQYITKGPAYYQNFGLNYLEIPVLINYRVWKSLSIDIGPSIGAPIFESKYHKGAPWVDMDFSEYALDAGFIAGLKYQLTNKVSLVARYNQSVLPFESYIYDLVGIEPDISFKTGNAYLRNLQLSVMYKLKR